MITITLPWPDPDLNPNKSAHWAKKARITKAARKYGYYKTLSEGYGQILKGNDCELEQYVMFYPPDRRRRDDDNHLRMIKAYRDGIFDALGIDDSRIKRTVLEWGEVVKGGKVVLRLEEMK